MNVVDGVMLNDADLSVSVTAASKFAELMGQVEDNVAGVRVYATAGGCSGVSFGMTFTDRIEENDGILDGEGFKVIVDDATMGYLRGVEIDFVDRGNGDATFVFNNLQPAGGGCGTCGSSGGGCG